MIPNCTMPLAVGDLVTVKFSGTEADIPSHEERIKEDGNITLPLIGVVRADGKTVQELEKEIRDRCVPDGNPNLSITVTGGQVCYFVGGQVLSCGRLLYLGPTTVTKAIESAGGFADFAAKHRVELMRADGKKIQVNCIKAAKDHTLDLAVYPGDKIVVPTHTFWDSFR